MVNTKILIGSPINQEPDILKEFLLSLANLQTDTMEIHYFFIDDNQNEESSRLLRHFAKWKKDVAILSAKEDSIYIRTDFTHFWNDALIWKVARFKDMLIEQAKFEEFDYLFLIDSDLLLHPDTLHTLISTKKEIVSEVFWTAWQEGTIPYPQVWLTDEYTHWRQADEGAITDEEKAVQTEAFIQQLQTPGVYEVGGLGACTLISRKALLAGVHFSKIKNLSFWGEDRHFCVRAVALGLDLHVDTHLPAYHIYRSSDLTGIPAFKEKCQYAYSELPIYPEKAESHQIRLSMIVKNEEGRYLQTMLKKVKPFIDEAVIIDDASTDQTISIFLQELKGMPIKLVKNASSQFANEVELRKQQWLEATNGFLGWVLNLDADEWFEESFIDYIDDFVKQDTIDLYCFRLYDMWDEDHYREDEYWQAHFLYRPFLARVESTFQPVWKETPQHCGRFPENIFQLTHSLSTIRVKHLGWAKEKDRLEKYERYKLLDPNSLYGNEKQYESILDKNPRLKQW